MADCSRDHQDCLPHRSPLGSRNGVGEDVSVGTVMAALGRMTRPVVGAAQPQPSNPSPQGLCRPRESPY